MRDITPGGPGLVVVGDGAVWTSPDGRRWTLAADEATWGYAVTEGGPGLVAVGEADGDCCDLSLGASNAAVWTSPDGTTWSRVPSQADVLGGPGPQAMYSVAAGGPGLVPTGSGLALWNRPDGVDLGRRDHMVAGLRPGAPGRDGSARDAPPHLRVRRFRVNCRCCHPHRMPCVRV